MAQSKPKTILIVDHDEAVRQAIAEVVQLYGWQVLEASNGVHGLRVFRNQLPDIVLTGVAMAGFGACKLRQKAQDVGASAFLRKPFEPEELLVALERSLGSSTSEKKS